ncbi:hypothetical protein [Cryptosporangium sp. NPDC051539]|uniref:hypothetical protein n=1 Tax=Cryptosporangium sp. NPDC051539 TaxID=3363962 RepID=UPI0037991543
MTTGACVLIHRRAPERTRGTRPPSLVCFGCERSLRSMLVGADVVDDSGLIRSRIRGLPELDAELAESLAATGHGRAAGVVGSSSTSAPLPFDAGVSAQRQAIAVVLRRWTGDVAEARGLDGPGHPERPEEAAPWLERQLEWIAAQSPITQFAHEIRALRDGALARLDPVHTARVRIGWCAETGADCPGALTAAIVTNDTTLPGQVACDTCSAKWSPIDWAKLGRALTKARREAVS